MKKSRKMWNYLIISHLKAKESSLIWYNPYFVIDHISIPGTGMEIACYAGEYHKKTDLISFAFENTPLICLTYKVVPVPYREYKYSLSRKR